MPLFYNENFTIDSKVIFIKDLYDRGFRNVRDLMDNNGKFISLESIETIQVKKFNYLRYFGLINTIQNFSRKANKNKDENLILNYANPCINRYLNEILINKKT